MVRYLDLLDFWGILGVGTLGVSTGSTLPILLFCSVLTRICVWECGFGRILSLLAAEEENGLGWVRLELLRVKKVCGRRVNGSGETGSNRVYMFVEDGGENGLDDIDGGGCKEIRRSVVFGILCRLELYDVL